MYQTDLTQFFILEHWLRLPEVHEAIALTMIPYGTNSFGVDPRSPMIQVVVTHVNHNELRILSGGKESHWVACTTPRTPHHIGLSSLSYVSS